MTCMKSKKFVQSFYQKYDSVTSSRLFCVYKKIKHNLYWKMKFLKQVDGIQKQSFTDVF